ncbi:DUF4845 domain-containing protein [Thauera mechernichensis]|uniref:DUF4845 domain-containing protein n=1 Tax=Thauera mechernichensis TaxID=82788 RepID=A0ABW3WFG1_9RHOO|nr:DUF4845 domain-containing protein [Thauera mechernichensis]MDG3066788.1 DUF4845 domain-containing protein [Thauera mechernichensis]
MRMKSQRGVTLTGVLVVGTLAAFLLILGFRTVPVFNEYLAIKRILVVLADEGDKGATVADLRRGFDTRRQIDDVKSIRGADLKIDKIASRTQISARYSRTVPLIANVSLLFDFEPNSEAR